MAVYGSLNKTTEGDWLQATSAWVSAVLEVYLHNVNTERLIGIIFCKSLFVHAIH
jgi:hypothetical protein